MKRQTLAFLTLVLLLAAFGLTAPENDTALASEASAYGEMYHSGGNHPPAIAGDDDEDDGPASSLDTGDGDDYWDGIMSDDGVKDDDTSMLQLVLETWMETNSWLFH